MALISQAALAHSTGAGATARTVVGAALNLLAAVTFFLAGRGAKWHGRSPAGAGALAGLLFGGLRGLSSFFIRVSPEEFVRQAQRYDPGVSTSMVSVNQVVAWINSPTAHLIGFLGTAAVGAVLGLVIAAAGGLFGRRWDEAERTGSAR